MSRSRANLSGNPCVPTDVSQAPTAHAGRAPCAPAHPHDAEVRAAGNGVYNPSTVRFVIQRYCELRYRRAALLGGIERDELTTLGSTGQTVMQPAPRHVETTERETRD